MMSKLVNLFAVHSPRNFAGYVVFAAFTVCTVLQGFAASLPYHYKFSGGGGTVNGKDTYEFDSSSDRYNTAGLTVAHTNPTLRCVGWYRPDGTKHIDLYDTAYYNFGPFTAKWVEDRYPIFFVSNFDQLKTNTQWVVKSQLITLDANTFTRDGYHLAGWGLGPSSAAQWGDKESGVNFDAYRNLYDEETKDSDGNPLWPVTLYAVWEENPFEYTVRFSPGDGSGKMNDLRMVEGESRKLPLCTFEAPVGFKFDHWTKEGGGSFSDGATIKDLTKKDSGDLVILIANWSTISYSIAYNANTTDPVEGSMANTEIRNYGERVNLRDCAFKRRGYSFAGWSRTPDGEVEYADHEAVVQNLTSKDGDVVTLYAQWTPVPYFVRFDGNGGEGEMELMACEYDRPYVLPMNAFLREGGVFAGWTTNGANTVHFTDGATISNLTSVANATNVFRAVWSEIAYHIRFSGNGGEGEIPEMDCEYGTVYQLPSNAYSRIGYVFTGWATNATTAAVYAEGESVSNLTQVADQSIQLFAAWRPISYRIEFSANGGEGAEMPALACVYDVARELPSNTYAKINRSFSGWATKKDGAVEYADGARVENLTTDDDATVILYAVWKKAVNELNTALDNDNLDFTVEGELADKVSVVEEKDAVNGTCVRIDSDNFASTVFAVLESAGKLTFRWRVVNEAPEGEIHIDEVWSVKLVDANSDPATNLFYHAVSNEGEAGTTEWAELSVEVPASATGVKFQFDAHKGNSEKLYALFDNVRWTSSENPEPTPEDAPVINGAATVEGGKFRVTFAADKRFKYELIKNATLAPSDWTSFVPQLFLESDEDGNVSFEPTVDPAEPKLFYRVKVLKKD